MTPKEIVEHAPQITDKDIMEINRLYNPYLFYSNTKDGRKYTCSCCHKTFDVKVLKRFDDGSDYELLSANHNEYVMCPKCRTYAQVKNKGRAKTCISLRDFERVVFIKPVSENKVYMIYAYTQKLYLGGGINGPCVDYTCLPNLEIETVYVLSPGEAHCYKLDYWNGGWYEANTIEEPFTKTYYYNTAALINPLKKGYTVIGTEKLKKTFLKYYDFREIMTLFNRTSGEGKIMKVICTAAKYPISEYVLKSDFKLFFRDKVAFRQNNARLVNWDAKSPREFFKTLSVSELKVLSNNKLTDPQDVKRYSKIRKIQPNIKICDFVELKDTFGWDYEKILSIMGKYGISARKILNYIEKQKSPTVMVQRRML